MVFVFLLFKFQIFFRTKTKTGRLMTSSFLKSNLRKETLIEIDSNKYTNVLRLSVLCKNF